MQVISPSTREHPITVHSAAQSPHSVKTETGTFISFMYNFLLTEMREVIRSFSMSVHNSDNKLRQL